MTSEAEPALAPCPFCGGECAPAHVIYSRETVKTQQWPQSKWHYVSCIMCGANNRGLVGHETPKKAAEQWNIRAPLVCAPALPQRVTELLAANNALVEARRELQQQIEGLHATIEAQRAALVEARKAQGRAEQMASDRTTEAAQSLRASLQAAQQRDGAHAMLRLVADQFLFYAGQHDAKGTPESAVKALVNRDWAARCLAVIREAAEAVRAQEAAHV